MLHDMPEIRARAKPLDKAARTAQPAVVLVTARQELQKPVNETGNLIAFAASEVLQIEFHHQDRLMTVYIRTWNCTNIQNLHSDLYSNRGVELSFLVFGKSWCLRDGAYDITRADGRFRRNGRIRPPCCRT